MKKTSVLKSLVILCMGIIHLAVYGQIEISDFEYPSAGMDNGSITISANGDAGPFTISINEVDRPAHIPHSCHQLSIFNTPSVLHTKKVLLTSLSTLD